MRTPRQEPGIYLIVNFDWPPEVTETIGENAHALHQAVQNKDWIKEAVTASGGLGAGPSSIWIFWLENYAALDRLLRDRTDPVSQTYVAFFSQMPLVEEKIREGVVFVSSST